MLLLKLHTSPPPSFFSPPPSPSFAPSSPSQPLSSICEIASKYFKDTLKITDVEQLKRLLKAVKGYVTNELHSQENYRKLFSNIFAIFERSEFNNSSTRIVRLMKGRKRVSKTGIDRRLSLLFLHHEILESKLLFQQEEVSKQGVSPLSFAFKSISKETSEKVEDLKDSNYHVSKYMLLLEESGPGDLLELGQTVSL